MNTTTRIFTLALCVAAASCSQNHVQYYWVMAQSCPDSGVGIWFPADLPDHKDCDPTPVTPALALAIVLNIIQDADRHKMHYHIREEDRGFILTEFLADPQSKTGERPLGSRERIHYHGVFVDLDTAKKLITVVKAHQHGAE